jgi:hypothetical protein
LVLSLFWTCDPYWRLVSPSTMTVAMRAESTISSWVEVSLQPIRMLVLVLSLFWTCDPYWRLVSPSTMTVSMRSESTIREWVEVSLLPFACWSWFCLCFGRVTPTDVWCLPQRWRWWCVRNRRSDCELKFPSGPFACWSWFCLCFGRVTPTDVWCLTQRWRWWYVRNRRSVGELKFPSCPFACWSWFCLCFGRVTTGWSCSVLIHRSAMLEVSVNTGKTVGETKPVSCVLLESFRYQLVRPPLFTSGKNIRYFHTLGYEFWNLQKLVFFIPKRYFFISKTISYPKYFSYLKMFFSYFWIFFHTLRTFFIPLYKNFIPCEWLFSYLSNNFVP